MRECTSNSDVGGADMSQPFVVFLGTSVHFSDQLLRLLRLEFDGVRFDRLCESRDLSGLRDRPSVVIIHGLDPSLHPRVEDVRANFPDAMIAIACADIEVVQQLNHPGCSPPVSVLHLNAQLDVWLSVLRLLLCGHIYVPIEFLNGRQTHPDRASEVQLTPREMEILPLIAEGKQNKVIAADLGLSEHTVKLHTHNIFSKLRVSNRTGAANWYLSQVEA